jgi:hypothetical protein
MAFGQLTYRESLRDIVSCIDKVTGLELVGQGCWNVAQVLEDTSDTWSHRVARFDQVVGAFGDPKITVYERGLLQASLLVERLLFLLFAFLFVLLIFSNLVILSPSSRLPTRMPR